MSTVEHDCRVFEPEELLPDAWRSLASGGPVRTFNPGLLREGDGWIMAYRVVGSDGRRRIALCRLDSALRVISGSPIAWTDHIRFGTTEGMPPVATEWFADPRLYRLRAGVFVYWNSGWHEPRNWQFVQEIDATTLLPIGSPRELLLQGPRQKLEKNWTFFETGDPEWSYAVYSITPHRVLRFSLHGEGAVAFEEVAKVDWSLPSYPPNHGGLRGGAPPVLRDGEFWSFCHSVHDGTDGYRYAAAAYRFSGETPFAPTARPIATLDIGRPFSARRRYERLNPAVGEVIYPCGAAEDGARWLISHGINDEQCAISLVPHASVLATLEPLLVGA